MEENKENVAEETAVKEKTEEPEVKENTEDAAEEKEDDALTKANAEIEKLKADIAKLKNDYARAYADTDNMRKRLQKEADMAKKYRAQSFVLDILPVLDNCERALAQETTDESYRKGVEMMYKQLVDALKKEGVEEIDALNKPFDANFHQAIMAEAKDGVESGIVIQVFQKGYKLKDRILRAAMVKVSE